MDNTHTMLSRKTDEQLLLLAHNTHNTALILHSLPKTILAEKQNLKVAPFPSAFTASEQKSYCHSSVLLLRK